MATDLSKSTFMRTAGASMLALMLSACATTRESVVETTTAGCMDQRIYTKSQVSSQMVDVEVATPDGATVTEQREEEVEKIVRRHQENLQFNHQCAAHQVVVLTAQAQRDSELGVISSMALLRLASSNDPATESAIIDALKTFNSSLEEHQSRVSNFFQKEASDFIANQAAVLLNDQGEPNYPAISVILDLRTQNELPEERRRFPGVDPVFLRETVDAELGRKNLTPEMLLQVYRAGFNRGGNRCTTVTNKDGSSRTRCGTTDTSASPEPLLIN